ncbi:helix-turn-helix domain-containing protein [Flindersiella endophytica]
MTETADVLSAFVDLLADVLDDPCVTGAELARRLHLSRFHADRVIASAAGEPPARLRRRVLLERAAYRLATSDRTILDVAVEAGYSSHEAFTRAFARAYGEAPVQWRRHPARIELEAPNDVHFHPPGGLRLPARRKVTSMDLVVRIVEHNVWLIDQMLSRAAGLSDSQLGEPISLSVEGVDDDPTLRSLLSRLVGQLDMWTAMMAGQAYDFAVEQGESVSSMRQRLAGVGPRFVAEVRRACEESRLEDMVLCPGATPEETGVYTYGGMIAHVITYAAHRRTLVAGALHDAGVRDLDEDPIHWIAEPA